MQLSKKRVAELLIDSFSETQSTINFTEDTLKRIDYEKLCDADDILKNYKSFSTEKWESLIEKYKNDSFLIPVFAKCKEMPPHFSEKILENYNKFNSRDKKDALIYEFIYHNLSDNSISLLTTNLSFYKLKDLFNIESYSSSINVPLIPEKTKTVIADIFINKATTLVEIDAKKITPADVSPLFWIKDETYLNNLLNRELNKRVREVVSAAIISNKVIDDKEKFLDIMVDALDDCSLDEVKIPNTIISEELSKLTFPIFISHYISETGYFKGWQDPYFSICRNIVDNLIKQNALYSPYERDFANRLINSKIKSNHSFTQELFSRTTDPEIIKNIDQLLSHNKQYVYNHNPNIPEEMFIARAKGYCDKIQSLRDKGKEQKISDAWYEELGNIVLKATLPDKLYDILIESYEEKKLLFNLARSAKTPIHILDKIIETTQERMDQNLRATHEGVLILAKISKFCKENNIDPTIPNLMEYSLKSGLLYNDDKERLEKQYSYEIQELRQCARTDPDNIDKLILFLKEYQAQPNKHKYENTYLANCIPYIEEGVERKRERETKEYKDYSRPLSHQRYLIRCACNSNNPYINLMENLEELDILLKNKEKQELNNSLTKPSPTIEEKER